MVMRWRFTDPYSSPVQQWTVPINPNSMTSIFPEKNVTVRTTTAVNGKTLLFEGNTPPAQWEFGGVILNHAHHAELLRWVEKRNRVQLRDHFGREFWVYLLKFDPEPRRARRHYWKHDYQITALVLSKPSPATVGI